MRPGITGALIAIVTVISLPARATVIDELKKDLLTYQEGLKKYRFTVRYLIKRYADNKDHQLRFQKEKEIQAVRGNELKAKLELLSEMERKLKQYSGKNADPFWTPELLWRLGLLYYDIGSNDEELVKYQELLKSMEVGKSGVVPAKIDETYYTKKAVSYLKRVINEFPNFRNILVVKYMLMRLYEEGSVSGEEASSFEMAGRLGLSIVCHNTGYNPFKDSLAEFLKDRLLRVLPPNALEGYRQIISKQALDGGGVYYLFNVKDLRKDIAIDPFIGCEPPPGPINYAAWGWLDLGRFLSKYSDYMLESNEEAIPFFDVDKANPDSTVIQFNKELTNWVALLAYKRLLAHRYDKLSYKPYVFNFIGVSLDRTSAPADLALFYLARALESAYEAPEGAAVKTVIPLVSKYFVSILIDVIGDWNFMYHVKCDSNREEIDEFYAGDCIMKRIMAIYGSEMGKPYVKELFNSFGDIFMDYGYNLRHFLVAYKLYKTILFNNSDKGGWHYYSRKPEVFDKLINTIDSIGELLKRMIAAAYTDEDRALLTKKRDEFLNEKKELYTKVNEIFPEDKINNFLADKRLSPRERRDIAASILEIRQNATVDIANTLWEKADDLFKAYKEAKSPAEKSRLRKKALKAFSDLLKYYMKVRNDYKGSSMEYKIMWGIMGVYLKLKEIAGTEKERKEYARLALTMARDVRDSLLSDEHKVEAAKSVIGLYRELGVKEDTIPEFPWQEKAKKEDEEPQTKEYTPVPKELPQVYQDFIKDAYIFMELFPKDELTYQLELTITKIYFAYMHMDKARSLAWKWFDEYCSKDAVKSKAFAQMLFSSYRFEKVPPEKEDAFKKERDEAFKRLESAKCKGADKEFKELIQGIGLLKLKELIDLADKEYQKAYKKGDDAKQWRKVRLLYKKLVEKIKARKWTGKRAKKMEGVMFLSYWRIAEAEEGLGNYQGSFDVYYNRIYKDDKMASYADKEGYRENLLYSLALAAENFFKEKLAEEVWTQLTKEGKWRVRDPKSGKIRTHRYSQYRFIAWERLLALHESWEEYPKVFADMDELINLARNVKPMINRKVTVKAGDDFEAALAKALGISQDDVIKYVVQAVPGQKDTYYLTDKVYFYREKRLNIMLKLATRSGASMSQIQKAMDEVESFLSFLNRRVPESESFKKENEFAGLKRLDLLYTKMKLVEKLRRQQIRYKRWSKADALKKKYLEYLRQYYEMFEKAQQAGLNVGGRWIYYGEALLEYARAEFVSVLKSPFNKTPKVFDALSEFMQDYRNLINAVKMSGEQLQKRQQEVTDKFNKLKQDYTKRYQEYTQEISKYIQLLKQVSAMAQQLQQNPNLQKDKKFINQFTKTAAEYKKYHKKYGKVLQIMQQLQKQGVPQNQSFSKAMEVFITGQKDMKKMMDKMNALGKELQAFQERTSKSSQKMILDFYKKYNKIMDKALEELKKVPDDMAEFIEDKKALSNIRKAVDGQYKQMKQLLDGQNYTDVNAVWTIAATYHSILTSTAKLTMLYRSSWLMEGLQNGVDALKNLALKFDYSKAEGKYRQFLAKVQANLYSLVLNVLGTGLDYYKDAPYPEKYYKYLWDHGTLPTYFDKAENLPADLKQKQEVTGKEWWEKVYKTKGFNAPTMENYLQYYRDEFYKAKYVVGGNTVEDVPSRVLSRQYDEIGMKLRTIVTREGVWSPDIDKALRGLIKRRPNIKVPPPQPMVYKIKGTGR